MKLCLADLSGAMLALSALSDDGPLNAVAVVQKPVSSALVLS